MGIDPFQTFTFRTVLNPAEKMRGAKDGDQRNPERLPEVFRVGTLFLIKRNQLFQFA